MSVSSLPSLIFRLFFVLGSCVIIKQVEREIGKNEEEEEEENVYYMLLE
jgi:hypothetical protein